MSTKVYDAYIASHASFIEFFNDIKNKAAPKVERIALDLYYEFLYTMAAHIYDGRQVTGEVSPREEGASPYSEARHIFDERDRKVKTSRGRDPVVDLEFIVTLFPIDDNVTLVKIFSEQKKMISSFVKTMELDNFEYWNNTDPPEDISDEDWEKRGEIWDVAMDRHTPAKSGLTIDIVPTPFYGFSFNHKKKSISKYLPSLEKRARSIASYKISNQYATTDKYLEAERSGEFEKKVKEEVKVLMTVLKPELTDEDLRES